MDNNSGQHDYGFIMQDKPLQKRSLIPGNGGTAAKIVVIGVGLVVAFVILSFLKNLILPGPDFAGFIEVAQDQQAINNTVDNALKRSDLIGNTRDIALTTKLSIDTDQKETLGYLALNKQKIKPKILMLKVSAKTNNELALATSAVVYDETWRSILKEQLATYQSDLKETHTHFKGAKGKEVLSNAYDHSLLLSKKLDSR